MALRVVTFWASKIADPGAELGIFTIPNETFFVFLSPPRVLVSGTGSELTRQGSWLPWTNWSLLGEGTLLGPWRSDRRGALAHRRDVTSPRAAAPGFEGEVLDMASSEGVTREDP